jgi:hypothetical protein
MLAADIDTLDAALTWWVPAVRAPRRDWAGAPGCRRGARFLIDEQSCRPARDHFSVVREPVPVSSMDHGAPRRALPHRARCGGEAGQPRPLAARTRLTGARPRCGNERTHRRAAPGQRR